MAKIRVLFFGEGATLCHISRPLALASSLDRSRYDLAYACSSRYRDLIDAADIPWFEIYTRPPEELEAIIKVGGVLYDESILSAYAEEDSRVISEYKPDVVVGDMRLSLAVSAALAEVPYVSITSSYWTPYMADPLLPLPAFEQVSRLGLHNLYHGIGEKLIERLVNLSMPAIFRRQAAGLDSLRVCHNLPPFADYLSGFSHGDRTVLVDTPTVAPCKSLPSHMKQIGPVLWSKPVPFPSWWKNLPQDKTLIYIGLGSSGAGALVPQIVEAVGELPVSAVVSTSGKVGLGHLPPNVFADSFVPVDAVLDRASLAVTNGGTPATYHALSHGVPVLGIPWNMDQLLCMKHARASGAVEILRTDSFSPRRFKKMVTRLLGQPGYQRSAKLVQTEFKKYDTGALFESVLRHALDSGRAKSAERRMLENSTLTA